MLGPKLYLPSLLSTMSHYLNTIQSMKTGLLHITCPIRVKPDPILQILLPVWKMDVLYISYVLNKTLAECLENELVDIKLSQK